MIFEENISKKKHLSFNLQNNNRFVDNSLFICRAETVTGQGCPGALSCRAATTEHSTGQQDKPVL
jgi:hypothetical protein